MKKKPTKKPQLRPTLKLNIDTLDSEGIGQARHENKIALVQGAFPGETVIAEVEHEGRTHVYTKLRRVLRNAPQRTANNPCKKELECLGCPLIGMKYQNQLDYKQQRVEKALADQSLLREQLVLPTLASEPAIAYRASAKLVFGRKREKVLIGLYKRGSHEVIDTGDCPVHHPLINKIIKVVKEEVEHQSISVYSSRHKNGLLRYLLVRVSPENDKAMVTFVSNFRDLQQLPKLGKWLMRKVPEVIAVHQNVNSSTGNVILGQETIKLHGLPDLIDQVGDIKLRIGPEAFFQVNTLQAARIYALVRQWAKLTKRDSTIDVYCGIGGIGLHLAKDAGDLIGIEYVEQAVRNAADNAKLNRLENCRFVAGDAAEQLSRQAAQLKNLRLVTLNPPRKGCAEELLQALCAIAPPQIIYVSCDPASLARDLRILVNAGYLIEQVQPVDMFPQTAHVETVVELKFKGEDAE
ncbi:23S rRNA (uracil(1939)-C(5))-methyltransferase RlmD [Malonomonas rubra]|uniref:23S rRNA (uracil(1939)-C(5))-methyltransferase RlmD n=1 Tax=Malonomonas rubra TaxID=57040 RepID=UPI000934AAC3|nr:23S rRNA (uracil(1939)-C(5))-methyltransferase RlmD [Malonomonas rubra]